jgi:hypothetical protein
MHLVLSESVLHMCNPLQRAAARASDLGVWRASQLVKIPHYTHRPELGGGPGSMRSPGYYPEV